MDKCPICKAINEQRLEVLYEDEELIAFLHISPINYGHTLIVPRAHYQSLTMLSPELQGKLFSTGARLAAVLSKVIKGNGFNIHYANHIIAGQALEHCHLHLIPREAGDGFHWNWRTLDANPDRNREIMEKVHKRLETD